MEQEKKRQLNALVAQSLGYEIISGEIDNVNPIYNNGHRLKEMDFSGSWAWAGVLIEKAREQGIYIDVLPQIDSYICEAKTVTNQTIGSSTRAEAPYAACLAYLEAHGITV